MRVLVTGVSEGIGGAICRQVAGVPDSAIAICVRKRRAEVEALAGGLTLSVLDRIPGAPHPPSAAWNSAVTSGTARMLDPKLRFDLGYFYSEFVGIHENYDRYNQFTEREVLPRLSHGPDAFYGADGKLLPMFRVHMDLESEFASDLRRLGKMAHDLRLRLEALSK